MMRLLRKCSSERIRKNPSPSPGPGPKIILRKCLFLRFCFLRFLTRSTCTQKHVKNKQL